ncbi:proteasome maturation factor UMP1-domain-containing protein [Zalerion maritima]|uniref:Proteasome maturation factor UMP1-domain-containing protein n=1 Tax=Zalerion maritima TaxID=339359 RepID=A0AAD5RWY9_9PEZI|nr:proteasome maturation factor UMP1-domain-containing protein [Zalerion maritima]
MSLRVAPAKPQTTTYSHIKTASAPSAPGIHDTLRSGLGPDPLTQQESGPTPPLSSHPLEHRLKQWEATQDTLRMEMLRRTYGIAEPVRRQMELKIVRAGTWRPVSLGGNVPNLHEEILRGKDATITWEDVFTGEDQAPLVGFHDEMERKLKI